MFHASTKTWVAIGSAIALSACSNMPSANSGLPVNAGITMDNTIQIARPAAQMGTDSKEIPIEALIGKPVGSMTAKLKVDPKGVELRSYLGLWDVDFAEKSISFANIVNPAKQPFPGFLRVIEAGTFDRYYIRSESAFCTKPSVDKPFIKVECQSERELKITIGEGYDNRQSGFKVSM
jgi:hypothetical protein